MLEQNVLCTVYCVLCTVYCVLCTVYCVLCTVYCVLCTVYCVLWTQQLTLNVVKGVMQCDRHEFVICQRRCIFADGRKQFFFAYAESVKSCVNGL
jgi:hypothetical protein